MGAGIIIGFVCAVIFMHLADLVTCVSDPPKRYGVNPDPTTPKPKVKPKGQVRPRTPARSGILEPGAKPDPPASPPRKRLADGGIIRCGSGDRIVGAMGIDSGAECLLRKRGESHG